MQKENSTYDNLLRFLRKQESGKTFIYADFAPCGSYTSIRSAVVKLCKDKELVRLCQGVYIRPNERGKFKMPDNITLALEIERKNNATATPKGFTKAYAEGKIKDCPEELIFWTNGSSRKLTLPDGTIVKYHKTIKKLED